MKDLKDLRFAKFRLFVFTVILLIVSIICLFEYHHLNSECSKQEVQEVEELPIETHDTVVNLVHKQSKVYLIPKQEQKRTFGKDERYLLAKIAMAEAEGESTEGKALVMQVVLNRVEDGAFPDTIGEVIFQHDGDNYQFTSVKNGRIFKHEPNDDCWKAMELIESGWDESEGALYFEAITSKSTWHSRNLELLFDEGGHQFYK